MEIHNFISAPELRPDILSQSNIPKPLHGVNPRTIMGKEKWDIFRKQVYASTNYHCIACGVHVENALFHRWLEAHEDYNIDHENATMTVSGFVPLCHSCHSFVHSGFLVVQYRKGIKSKSQVCKILEHGFSILEKSDLPAFIGLKNAISECGYGGKWSGRWIHPKSMSNDWSRWKMIWEGVEYPAKFKSHDAWKRYYQ